MMILLTEWCGVECCDQWDFNAMKVQFSEVLHYCWHTDSVLHAVFWLQAVVSSLLTSHCSIVGLMLNHLLSGAAGGHSFCRPAHSSWCWCQNWGRKIKCSQLPAVQTKYNTERCTFLSFQRWLLTALPMACSVVVNVIRFKFFITFKIFIRLSLRYFYPLPH